MRFMIGNSVLIEPCVEFLADFNREDFFSECAARLIV